MKEKKKAKEIYEFIEKNGSKQLLSIFDDEEYEEHNRLIEQIDSLEKETDFMYLAGEINAYLG